MRSTRPNSRPRWRRPVFAGEQVVFAAVELAAAPRLHQLDEALVDSSLDRLQALDVLRVFRQERIEHRLVDRPTCRCRRSTPIFSISLVKAERAADHADRADDRGRIGDDLVGRAGDHVAAGGRDILDEGDHRHASSRRRARGCAGRSGATATAEPPGELIRQRDRAARGAREGAFERLATDGKRQTGPQRASKSRSRRTGAPPARPECRCESARQQRPQQLDGLVREVRVSAMACS